MNRQYLVFIFLSIFSLSCGSEQHQSEHKPLPEHIAKVTDSIAFDSYVVSLIEQGAFVNPDCIAQKSPIFLKDSIYKEAQKYPWFIVCDDWYLSRSMIYVWYPVDSNTIFLDVLEGDFGKKTIEHKDKLVTKLQQFEAYLQIIDAAKNTAPDYEHWKTVMSCGGGNILYYDGAKFYGLTSANNQLPLDDLSKAISLVKFVKKEKE